MRHLLLAQLLGAASCTGLLNGQALTDFAAAATGSTAGVAAGKQINNAVNPVFGKMAKQMEKAAGTASAQPKQAAAPAASAKGSPAPLLDIGPGVPKKSAATTRASVPSSGGVPLPPPPERSAPVVAPPAVQPIVLSAPPAPAPAPAPPAPRVTPDELKNLANGTSREELLKLGQPALRVTMFEDGHLLESYRYADRETAFGHVHLTDGVVSAVELK